MLSILFALLLLTLWCYRRRRRRAGHVLAVLALLLFVGTGCGALPRLMMRGLQDPYRVSPAVAWAPRNVIVLLAAGTAVADGQPLQPSYFANGRILRAAQLYRECKDSGHECRLLVSGGDSQGHGEAEATVYGRSLRALGVAEPDLLLETRSLSTWQNAQFSRPILVAQAPQRVVLVTSGLHLRRSLLYFAHFGIVPEPVAGDWVNTRREVFPDSWDYVVADACLHEYLGILRYYVYNAMGWNAPRAQPLGA